jgi:hypothetical protein
MKYYYLRFKDRLKLLEGYLDIDYIRDLETY